MLEKSWEPSSFPQRVLEMCDEVVLWATARPYSSRVLENTDHCATFCLEHSDFGLAHSHFWKWFLASVSPSLSASWSAPSWLLILSALLVILSGWGRAEKSEVFYVPGCRPYEVMTGFCGDIRSVFPIEISGVSGAESLVGAESKWNEEEIKLGMGWWWCHHSKAEGAKEQTEQGEGRLLSVPT